MGPSRFLLTGAGGFVGSHLCQVLRQRYPDARVTGVLSPNHLRGRENTLVADLLDDKALSAILRDEKPDVVVHLAAQSSVGLSQIMPPASTWMVNVTGSLNLALAIARWSTEATVLFASSAEVYGRSLALSPVTEASLCDPVNAYARSKALAEQVFAEVLPPTARLLVARPFNHTGPGQREDFVLPSFAGQIARIEAGLQEPRIRVGNLEVSRDFLDVRDVVDAYLSLIAAAARLPARFTVNIASGKPRNLRALLETMREMSRVPFEIVIDPDRLRPNDIPVAYSEAKLLRETTGWSPKIDSAEMLSSLLDAARLIVANGKAALE